MVTITKLARIKVMLGAKATQDAWLNLIPKILDDRLNAKCASIEFDFSQVEGVGIGGIAILSNLVEMLHKSGVKVSFSNYRRLPTLLRYLVESGFYATYLDEDATTPHSPSILPLSRVRGPYVHGYITHQVIPWIEGALGVGDGAAASIHGCFLEIFNNIADHSTEEVGCAVGGIDPATKKIEVCVSDFGIGIPNQVKTKVPGLTDAQAIVKACEEGFTTRTTPRNRGAGLATLLRSVVARNGGEVTISSGYGYLRGRPTDTVPSVRATLLRAPYPGTLIRIKLDAEKFKPVEVKEEFEW